MTHPQPGQVYYHPDQPGVLYAYLPHEGAEQWPWKCTVNGEFQDWLAYSELPDGIILVPDPTNGPDTLPVRPKCANAEYDDCGPCVGPVTHAPDPHATDGDSTPVWMCQTHRHRTAREPAPAGTVFDVTDEDVAACTEAAEEAVTAATGGITPAIVRTALTTYAQRLRTRTATGDDHSDRNGCDWCASTTPDNPPTLFAVVVINPGQDGGRHVLAVHAPFRGSQAKTAAAAAGNGHNVEIHMIQPIGDAR